MVPAQATAQHTENCFPVWQGFSQEWGYPQRMQVFGDWVIHSPETDRCKVWAGHGAACDKPDDIAHFAQYYALVHSEIVQSIFLSPNFTFSGREGELLRDSTTLEVEIPALADQNTYFDALLAGFALYVDHGTQADNLQRFDLEIDSIWHETGSQKLSILVKAAIQFSCEQGDCEPLNQIVEYNLAPNIMVLAGQGFRSTTSTFGSGRSWEKRDTAMLPPMARVALLGNPHYQSATVGIRGMHIQLDRAHSMLAWESRVLPLTYKDGLLLTGVGMAYRQNDAAMYDAYRKVYHGRHKLLAKSALKPKAGSMVWEMDVVMLQFEDAKIEPKSRSGKIEWIEGEKKRDGAARNELEIKE